MRLSLPDDGTYAVAQSYLTGFGCWCSPSFSGPAQNHGAWGPDGGPTVCMSCYVEAKE
jgi:hypothetical protein